MLAPGDLNADGIADLIVGYERREGDVYSQCKVAAYSGADGAQIWQVISRPDANDQDIDLLWKAKTYT